MKRHQASQAGREASRRELPTKGGSTQTGSEQVLKLQAP
jgi:hypothetical protein